jgi:long-chain acyl-CoA synthetase
MARNDTRAGGAVNIDLGVNPENNFGVCPSLLHSGLEDAADRLGSRTAVIAGEQSWSFRDLDTAGSALAAHLSQAGIASGMRVGLIMANRPEFVVTVNAVSKLGAAAVLLSPAWKRREVDHAWRITGFTHAVADGAGVELLSGCIGADAVVDIDQVDVRAMTTEPGAARPDVVVPATADAVLVFSSGTTGLPKAVRHTHVSMGHATRHWCEALGLGPDDRFQVATPPSHILGLLNLLAAARAGASVRLHLRFDLDEVLRRIESDRMTLEMAVAPIALAMANHPNLEQYDLSSLRYIMWGATPVTPSVAAQVTARTGVPWLAAYGASEVPVIACNPVRDPAAWRLDSAGLPPNGVRLRVADLETGEVLGPEKVGEIQIESPSVMAGYLPDSATPEAFADGWYRTGDVGWLEPEGWVHLTDRAKEMIKVKGFQVAPAEIEAVLHGHPAVRDCAVFGLPDEQAGEVPVAAVALEPGTTVTGPQLQLLVAESLASYKQLHEVVIVETIPRLPSGKVLRRDLRDALAPALAGRVGA